MANNRETILNKLLLFCVLIVSFSCGAKDIGYDPKADPFHQLEESAKIAKAEHKYILVVSGGDWCRWCHVLDDYLNTNKPIYDNLRNSFVFMKVYLGDKNYNDEFFSQLPVRITGSEELENGVFVLPLFIYR